MIGYGNNDDDDEYEDFNDDGDDDDDNDDNDDDNYNDNGDEDGYLPFHPVEDEPAFLPGLDPPAHLVQPAATAVRGDDHVGTRVQQMPRPLHMRAQVKISAGVGQEARHGAGLLWAEIDQSRSGVVL